MTEEQANNLPKKRRIFELDLLRGFFVVIIIIDHLQLWPSPLRYLTGEGRLWVTAAEGFFLISGLLVGYIRGFKNKDKSLKDISIKLIKRAGILYIWGVGITLAIIFFTKMYGGGSVILPDLPNKEQMESIPHLLWAIVSTDYFSPWIYFLRLYAIMLLATPVFILLLRQGKYHIIIFLMATTYYLSKYIHEAALEWQLLFFGAALINYRKRTELDIESARRNGGDAMILKLLPVIDTLERAISHIPSDIAENSWVKGVSGVAKNLNKTLKSIDVIRIDAKPGQEFNPELHYAVQVDENASGEHEIISEELQAGYMRNGVVLRHTMVKVTRK